MWNGEDTDENDEICVRALDMLLWGEEYEQDEKLILKTYDKLLTM